MTHFDREKLRAMHNQCLARGSTAAKGKALEDLAEHVFLAVPSVTLYQRDVRDDSGSQEIDLVFGHLPHVSQIPIQDVTIMVECKNEAKRTSADEVSRFAFKLKSRALTVGVLVSRGGLSGTEKTAAHSAIRDCLAQDRAIIVVHASELANLDKHDELPSLLGKRLIELRTFRTYRSI